MKHGRFLGSQKLAVLPQVEIPSFIKTEIPLSPVDLQKKIAGTNAKELVSFQELAALNIHLGGDKDVSKKALTEYLCNLTFQALGKENDNILMSFDSLNDLAYDINERLAKIELYLVNDSNILSNN